MENWLTASAPVSVALGGLVDVQEVLKGRRRDVQSLLDVVEAVDHACVTDASLSDVVPSDSWLSATKFCDVADHVVEVANRVSDLVGVVGKSLVTAARFWLRCRSKSPLSCNADTRIDRFFNVLNRSPL